MRILELFAGYGSQALALKRLGFDVHSETSEIDKYAIEAYGQIHGETKNWGDICKINEQELGDYDLITFSSPCQDFSQAGLQKGGEEGSGTRSSLLWECRRIIKAVKPKYLLMENVKALTTKKFMPLFQKWLDTLDSLGYNNYWKVLNAKDYGVPQNRERVFVVSIRKDLNQSYEFPKPFKLDKRLKDVLEKNVDEKFYLSQDKVDRFIKSTKLSKYPFETEYKVLGSTSEHPEQETSKSRQWVMDSGTVSPTLDATMYKSPKQFLEKDVANTIRCGGRGSTDLKHSWDIVAEPVIGASRGRNPENPSDRTTGCPTEQRLEINSQGVSNTLTSVQKDNYVVEPTVKRIGNIFGKDKGTGYAGNVWDKEGMSPTLTTMQGGCREPMVTVEGYFTYPNSDKKHQSNTVISKDGISTTLDTMSGDNSQPKIIDEIYKNRPPREYGEYSPTLRAYHAGDLEVAHNMRIRKLTPRECWRLMGVDDSDFNKLHDISNSQLYKLAGNSIVVDVLYYVFRNLFCQDLISIMGE